MFTRGAYELPEPGTFSDEELPWDDPTFGDREPDPEIVDLQLRTGHYLQPVDAYTGCVLVAQDLRGAVGRDLRGAGTDGDGRGGLLKQFSAILVGRATARSLDAPRRPDERSRYRNQQRETFAGAMADYNPDRVDPQRHHITVTY